jgi:hypothetical protein
MSVPGARRRRLHCQKSTVTQAASTSKPFFGDDAFRHGDEVINGHGASHFPSYLIHIGDAHTSSPLLAPSTSGSCSPRT